MASSEVLTPQRSFGETERRDLWWLQPLFTTLGLSLFVVYATWAAFQGTHYLYGPATSRLSTLRFCSEIQHTAGWVPDRIGYHHGFRLLCWFFGLRGFRLTCYYYRGAYYKAFWADPPSCTVSEPRKSYRGENSFR